MIDFTDYCGHCGKELPQDGRYRLYCCSKCERREYYRLVREAKLEARAGRCCQWCGASIPAEVHGLVRHCSERCARDLENVRKRQRRAKARKPKPARPCQVCGTPMHNKRADVRYCGRSCQGKALYRRKREARKAG